MTLNLNLFATLAAATALFFVGQLIVRQSALLQRYSIPVPVVGGFLFAVALALVGLVVPVDFTMDETLKDPLLLAFFATLGLGADVRSLARGGKKLVILLALFVALMTLQNAIGLVMARLLDLHPLVGLLGGSISLTGGHGTAAAYAASFGETRNLQGAMELGMAAATAGLILGSLLSGPVAERLMRRARARAATATRQAGGRGAVPQENPFFMPITTEQLLFVLLVCLACIGVAHEVHALMKGTGILLPDFLWALLVGMVVRNLATLFRIEGINDRAAQAVGGVSLSLFLIMALMSMRILDLATLAGPMMLIIVVNALMTALFAYFITGRVMGNDYDAAVVAGGHVAAGLATTAVAMSVMQTLTAAPRAGATRVPADSDRGRVLRGHRQRARAAGVLRAAGPGVLTVRSLVAQACSCWPSRSRWPAVRVGLTRPACKRDVQAQLDTLFGSRVLEVKSLRRQGSAPLAGAKAGGSQAIVYYNAVLAFTAPYDPSDWNGLSPELVANALGATDEGVIGLGAGGMAAGAQLRAYGSMVYRRAGDAWHASLLPPPTARPAANAGGPSSRRTSSIDSPASSTRRPDCTTRTTRSSPRSSTRRCRTSSSGSITGSRVSS